MAAKKVASRFGNSSNKKWNDALLFRHQIFIVLCAVSKQLRLGKRVSNLQITWQYISIGRPTKKELELFQLKVPWNNKTAFKTLLLNSCRSWCNKMDKYHLLWSLSHIRPLWQACWERGAVLFPYSIIIDCFLTGIVLRRKSKHKHNIHK